MSLPESFLRTSPPDRQLAAPSANKSTIPRRAGRQSRLRVALGLDGIGSNPWYKSAAHSLYNSLQASLKNHGASGATSCFLIRTRKPWIMARTYLTQPIVFNPTLGYGLSIFDLRHNFATSYTVKLPFDNYFGKGDIANRFTGGWALAGLTTFATGQPVRLSESDDRDLIGDFSFPFDTPIAA